METWICQACNGEVVPMGVLGQREHGRCRACGLDHNRAPVEYGWEEDTLVGPGPATIRMPTSKPPSGPFETMPPQPSVWPADEEEEGLTPEELADGMAQFDFTFRPIVTRPGENLIERIEEERQADEERFNNDMKARE